MNKLALIGVALLLAAGCKSKVEADSPKIFPVASAEKQGIGTVIEITTEEQFKTVIAQKNRLMVLDFYADWCGPCKQLAPILKKVASTHGTDADFYKINTEKLPQVASKFQVQGIPHVVFFKDSAIVNSYVGLYPQEAYEQSVEILSPVLNDTANGTVKSGVRSIEISADLAKGNVLTYRGDKVELLVKAAGKPFTVSIADLKVSDSSDGTKDVTLTFETKELGFMPLLITDKAGRKDRLWLGVIQYGVKQSGYREVEAEEFAKLTNSSNQLILDVRTPGEYNDGHLKGSVLIPVQELESRLSEIASSKDKTVLIYCRSGNRSTVGAKILQENGFNSVVNLRSGINGWQKANLPVVK